jgi:hypothetical protein
VTITVALSHPVVAVSPAVQILVTSSAPVSAPLQVVRVHEDGGEYPVITDSAPRLVGGSWTGIDRHAPFNQYVTYKAVGNSETGVSSEWTVLSDESWLIHGLDQDLSVMVDAVISFGSRQFAAPSTRHNILGSRWPVHESDGPLSTETGQATFWCDSVSSYDALIALFMENIPVCLNTPFSGFSPQWMWIQPSSISLDNPGEKDGIPGRFLVVPFEHTTQPDVNADPLWTWDDVTDAFATWADATADYASWDAMQFDVRT